MAHDRVQSELNEATVPGMEEDREVDRFVDAWGDLGRTWGIPRTTARIQALLLASEEPRTLDDITERLGISKGGASGRLKELRDWGLANRVGVDGDRRDHYVAHDDVWRAFAAMVRTRKEREFDPTAKEVRKGLRSLRRGASGRLRERLTQAGEVLDLLDGLGERLLRAGPAMRAVLRFVAGSRGD